jgi:hypothetical protein
MPPRQRNRLITWYLLLRDEWLPTQWEGLKTWCSAVRAEPILAWQTPKVRYAAFGLAVFLGIWVLLWALSLLAPAGAEEMQSRAKTANFHVVCSNPECKRHFLIKRKFGFDDFPVQCPYCKRETGKHAVRCTSATCRGRYVIPIEVDDELRCSECGAILGPAP